MKIKNCAHIYFLLVLVFSSCGKIPSLPKSTNTPNSSPQVSKIVAGPYAPGAYFKIQNEVDTAKDTRVYEFTYKKDGTFLLMQKSFPAGNLASGFFHKTTGTYVEDLPGSITHTVTYDSCHDLTAKVVTFSGDPADIINVVVTGNKLSLYSFLSWTFPKSMSDQMGAVTEDIGCTKF